MSDPTATANAAPPPAEAAPPQFDKLNRPFDPAKFRPFPFDSQGRWRNLRGGAPKGPRKPKAPAPDVTAQTAPTSAASQSAGQRAAAAPSFSDVDAALGKGAPAPATADTINPTAETIIGVIQTALVVIGEEEGVLSEQEKTLLSRPLTRVLKKYDVGEDALPCEVEMAFAVAVIVTTRLRRPKTATWFAKAKAWAVNAWFRRKGAALAATVREETATATP